MATRFEPNRRLLHILVGSNLYGSPNAAIRELIQNAWDAIQWRKRHGDGLGDRIEIRYSLQHTWFEIIDNGFGMDEHAIRDSFFDIGQDKLEVLGSHDREGQIGYFGIGVLSIFLVAERFEATTRRVNSSEKAIFVEVTGLDETIDFHPSSEEIFGTRIRIYPRADANLNLAEIPNIVRSYVRHVDNVHITDADRETSHLVDETWTLGEGCYTEAISNAFGIRSGRLAFSPAMTEHSGTLSTDLTICNSGFLVEHNVYDLLPTPTLGLCGEIDLQPHSVTMGMSRERIQRDLQWGALGKQLQDLAISLALRELKTGQFAPDQTGLDSTQTKRALLLWYHFFAPEPPFSSLYEELDRRVYETVPFILAE